MEITFNNQAQPINAQTSIQQLVNEKLGAKQKGVAVAVNAVVVPKSNWDNHILQANDAVLLITATQGG